MHKKTMLTLRYVKRTGASLSPPPIVPTTTIFFISTATATATATSSSPYPLLPSAAVAAATPRFHVFRELQAKDVALSFREWFKSGNNALFEKIFEILGAQVEGEGMSREAVDLALSGLGIRVSEALVLEVLKYRRDVLSCLKFFDWAGRQPGFFHTRSTFNAIFKILSKAKLMSVMLDFLKRYWEENLFLKPQFYRTLVMGYAVAGEPEIALQMFGRMRFFGVDLDAFTYHVLLNAFVEERFFDAVEMVAKQIRLRGFEGEVTHSIMVKSLCKQKELTKAELYIRELVEVGVILSGKVMGFLVNALCEDNRFEKARELMEEFRESSSVPMDYSYGLWVRNLIQAGKLDGALEFFHSKKAMDGFVTNLFLRNVLICRLLWANRLEEVYDLLMEMKEQEISPDEVTMNAALCFLCKAGMVEVALELYDSRAEFRLSPSTMAYNYLINTLCGNHSVEEACRVLKNSIDQGYFPGRVTFLILANALCREGKLDKMKELVCFALDHNFVPSDKIFQKYISALCRAGRVEDGYVVHGQLNRLNVATSENNYFKLISGFNKLGRGDIAARLLTEMQEKGFSANRKLFRAVICCFFRNENPEKQFFRLLELQLSCHEPNCWVYNFFIDGAGHARKPELARQVYEMMERSGIMPNSDSNILMLRAYLQNQKISDALNFFWNLTNRSKIGTKQFNVMIVGLSKAKRPEYALKFLREMRNSNLRPSLESYEELVRSLCVLEEYGTALNLINDMTKVGRHVSSFIGNVLLLHSLKTQKLYNAWVDSRDLHNSTSCSGSLGRLLVSFSDCISVWQNIEDLEEMIRQCFPLTLYTYNILLRKLCMNHMDHAFEFLNRLHQKGYEPNRWTYSTLAHGFHKHGKIAEAKRCVAEMLMKGLKPAGCTKIFI